MAYYKKQKLNGKWYPRSVTVGTLTTADVAERLSRMSTVTRGDVYAVLLGLGEVMGEMLAMGSSVKLDGLGTFYLVGRGHGGPASTPRRRSARASSASSPSRSCPEYSRTSSHAVVARTIVPRQVQWVSRDRTSE